MTRWTKKLAVGAAVAAGLTGTWFVLAFKNKVPGAPLAWAIWEVVRNTQRSVTYLAQRHRVPEGAVVFLGSSSVVRFPLAQLYPGAPALGRGLGAESVMELVARLDRTLPKARPSGVVIWAGANDLRALAADPPVIAERVGRLLDAVDARFPGVPFAIVGVTPWCEQTEADLERLRRLNEGLRALAFARGAAYIDPCRAPVTGEDGRLSPDFADQDRKHLGLPGYTQVARWLAEEGGEATAALSESAAATRRSPPVDEAHSGSNEP